MKYTLSTETKEVNGHMLHKIEYSEEFKSHIEEEYDIELDGGWIEKEENLSQDGNAWVSGNARVSQGNTTSMKIQNTKQWYEYQYKKAELQEKFDKENKNAE